MQRRERVNVSSVRVNMYSCYCYISLSVENICSHSKLILCFCF